MKFLILRNHPEYVFCCSLDNRIFFVFFDEGTHLPLTASCLSLAKE
jgi:hypothetical protein